jgi:hypothetical protein
MTVLLLECDDGLCAVVAIVARSWSWSEPQRKRMFAASELPSANMAYADSLSVC